MAEYTIINKCQICAGGTEEILSLGEIPLVDSLMEPGRTMPAAKYPTPLRYCPCCRLVQLGCIVDNKLRFPKDYPYTGGTTKILRDNFAGLAQEISGSISLG
ncbi:MAG: methyltransferase, partial [Candidatus Omnitrophica bacterium]|nr:methyltransferase [Candidatus Omnitrophota bacterium]